MKRITRTSVLKQAQQLARVHGESLTLNLFMHESGVSYHFICKLFVRWSDLRILAGLAAEAMRQPKKDTKEAILEAMTAMAARYGEQLTVRQFNIETGFTSSMITDRFGSWGNLREIVGLNPRAKPKRRYTNEELMEDLYRVYRSYRERPKLHKHRHRGGKISVCTFQNRFGSWEGTIAHFTAYLRRHGFHGGKTPLPEELEKKFDNSFKCK